MYIYTRGKRIWNIIILPARIVVTSEEGEPSGSVILEGPTGGARGVGPGLVTRVLIL